MSSILVNKTIECEGCEAKFSVKHDMSNIHYVVSYCCFCGSEIEIETTLDDFVDLADSWEEPWED
jgi:uncharacterized protein YfcZ (UPF0381/DUF406 family)